MDLKKAYNNFINRYPQYAKDLIGYEELPGDGLNLLFKDGHTAVYYPIEHEEIILPKAKGYSKKNAKNK